MATTINIGSQRSGGAPNSAQNTTKAVQNAVPGPSATSNAGTTAVGVGTASSKSKLMNILGKGAKLLGKLNIPGISTAANIADRVLEYTSGNDPEWWRSVPGDGLSTNAPLRDSSMGVTTGGQSTSGSEKKYADKPARQLKPFLLEMSNAEISGADPNHHATVCNPTDGMITQYLMPEIRKVVNAVPLQAAADYRVALQVGVSAYAAWRTLRKYDYLLKHGQTYLPNFNDPAFPLLQVKNAAWLQSTIGRLEEFLRASVRLPHTMCEYLAWKYGRVYRSNPSMKAAIVMYNFLPLTASTSTWETYLANIMAAQKSSAAIQAANTDLFNTYFDHDMWVEISDEKQFAYDVKEFMLRTNLDFVTSGTNGVALDSTFLNTSLNAVIIDSEMDNPTTFMASTLSTMGRDNSGSYCCLFPTAFARVYYQLPELGNLKFLNYASGQSYYSPSVFTIPSSSKTFGYILISPTIVHTNPSGNIGTDTVNTFVDFAKKMAACKAVDLYNAQQYLMLIQDGYSVPSDNKAEFPADKFAFYDLTSLSIDTGVVDDYIIGNEQVYGFANLVHIARKKSESVATALKPMASAVADLVDSNDVATVR